MGHVISASCECGYNAPNLVIGAGREDFARVCMQPAYCLSGAHVISVNIKDNKVACPYDGYADIALYFQDRSLQRVPGSQAVSAWQGREINDGAYLCPRCQNFNLKFSFPHTHFDGPVEHVLYEHLEESRYEAPDEHSVKRAIDSETELVASNGLIGHFESIEEARATGDFEKAADTTTGLENASTHIMARAIGRSLQLSRLDHELTLLVTAERERSDGRTSIAAQYYFAYICIRNTRIISSISKIFSDNKTTINDAQADSNTSHLELAYRALLPHAEHKLGLEEFDERKLLETIANVRMIIEIGRQDESSDLAHSVKMEMALSNLVWWVTGWRAAYGFFKAEG